jgi:hypothetical protein
VICRIGQVIARSSGNCDYFSERVAPGFTGFRLNGVQNPIAPVEDKIMKAADDTGTCRKRQLLPAVLSLACRGNGPADVGRVRNRYYPNDFASYRISNFYNVSYFDSEL